MSGYANPTPDSSYGLAWPVQTVGAGQQLTAEIITTLQVPCQTQDYSNEALFLDNDSGTTYLVRRAPPMLATVRVICGKIEYQKTVFGQTSNGTVSLDDKVGYRLPIHNGDSIQYNSVGVDDYLPPGFKFASMDR